MGIKMTQGSPPTPSSSYIDDAVSGTTTSSDPTLFAQPKICIIGCGIAGLTTALSLAIRGFSDISVYEHASNLGFVGAGIQLAPNMARVLQRLGVWTNIERDAVILHDTSICEGETDDELANVQLDYIKETYGFHHMVGHRYSLANGLYEGCLRHPDRIQFHFSMTVSSIESLDSNPTFIATPRDTSIQPSTVTCDILFGCDGIKSQVRTALLSTLPPESTSNVTIQDTNQAAYRIMIPRSLMLSSNNPALHSLIDTPRATRWIAPNRHIIAYPIQNHTIYNLSTVQPDTNFTAAPSSTYTTKGSKTTMLQVFEDFCPTVRDMLQLVPEGEVCEWKLRVHSPLPTWITGSVALVGDACHPTLPHLAQGAAQAIEDAAVIGACLERLRTSSLSSSSSSSATTTTTTTTTPPAKEEADKPRVKWWSPSSINRALSIYQTLRKSRAEHLVETAAASGRSLHLGEGSDKRKRDAMFAKLNRSNKTSSLSSSFSVEEKEVAVVEEVEVPEEEEEEEEEEEAKVPDKWADANVQKIIYGVDCERDVYRRWDELFFSP